MSDTQDAIDMQLERDDAGIEIAAIALCWAERPVVSGGPISEMTAAEYWRSHSGRERRMYLYRARAAVTAWEEFMEAHHA